MGSTISSRCVAPAQRKVRELNYRKQVLKDQKDARALETGEPQPPGPEDHDSVATDYSNPCAVYIPKDEDDDDASAPPLV